MSAGEIQYIADTLLIEKVIKLDSALTKEAGLVDEVFSGVGSAVSSFVKSNIDTSSPGALSKSVLALLVPGTLFRIHPLLSFLYYIGKEYGYDMAGMVSSITDKISDKIKAGEQVTPEEVNSAALSISKGASTDLFSELRAIEQEGGLLKTAQRGRQPFGGSMFPSSKLPVLQRIFGFLNQRSKGSGKSLMGGFIAWFVKTVLLSAGLLAVGGAAKAGVSKIKDDDKKDDAEKTQPNQEQSGQSVQSGQSGQSYTGQGQEKSKQSQESQQSQQSQGSTGTWYVPVLGGSVYNTITDWAVEFYPDLSGYEDIIERTPSYNKVVNELSEYVQGRYFVLPSSFNSREQIVADIATDAKQEIKKLKG